LVDNTRATLAPAEVWQEWFSAASESLASAIKSVSDDEISSAARHVLKSYLSYTETFRRVTQEYFGAFQPATRPDVIQVADLVGALEDKVDRLDEALGDLKSGYAKLISGDALDKVEHGLALLQTSLHEQGPLVERRLDQVGKQLRQVEQKLGSVDTAAGQLQKNLGEQASVVEHRLDRVEQKLDRMETAVSHVQSTLDRLITALEHSREVDKAEGKEAVPEEKAGTKHGVASGQPTEQG
jgi:archaellum component FlaC